MSLVTEPSTADPEPLTWLRLDLHTHCENGALVDAYVDHLDPRLDAVALTNHGQKPVFFQQHTMVAGLRDRWSGLVLFGVEWNTPAGGHACVIVPPGPDEADVAYELARRFDHRLVPAAEAAAALAFLGSAAAPQRPILFFNHPAPGQWSGRSLTDYRRHDPGGIVCGIEAVHGQRWSP